jgi:hypothetical protein
MPYPPPHFSIQLCLPWFWTLNVQPHPLSNADGYPDDIPTAVRILRRLEIYARQKQHLHQGDGHGVQDFIIIQPPGSLAEVLGKWHASMGRNHRTELAAKGEHDVEC